MAFFFRIFYVVSYLTIQSWTSDCTLPTSTEMCIIRVEFWRFFDTREISLYKCETCVLQVNDFQKVFFFAFFARFVTSIGNKKSNFFFFSFFFEDLQGFIKVLGKNLGSSDYRVGLLFFDKKGTFSKLSTCIYHREFIPFEIVLPQGFFAFFPQQNSDYFSYKKDFWFISHARNLFKVSNGLTNS